MLNVLKSIEFMDKKNVLFITSQFRVGERIYPIIPLLSKHYNLDLLKVYQMSNRHKWVGDVDLRNTVFDTKYLSYFKHTFYNHCDVSKYDLIISDDNRVTTKTNLHKIYSNKKGPLIACSHGNGSKGIHEDDYMKMGFKKSFDICFSFGKKENVHSYIIDAGIPSNDVLQSYKDLPKKHILIIINFLGNRPSPFTVNFDESLFNSLYLEKLQYLYRKKLPIVLKLKSRADEGTFTNNVKYLKDIFNKINVDYKIVVDVEDDNKLIAESAYVISAPSTLALKPIQLGTPTVLIKNSGALGVFDDYDGIFDKGEDFRSYLKNYSKKVNFIKNTITGGLDFNSTEIMFNKIKQYGIS